MAISSVSGQTFTGGPSQPRRPNQPELVLRDERYAEVSLASDALRAREDKLRVAHEELVRRRRGDPLIVTSGGYRAEEHHPRDAAAETRLEEKYVRKARP